MVAIHGDQGFLAHGEEARRLPSLHAGPHEPCRRRVPQGVKGDTLDSGALARRGKPFLDVADALTVDMQDIAKIASASAGASKVGQKAGGAAPPARVRSRTRSARPLRGLQTDHLGRFGGL